ncbi:hypothetical protein ACFX2C_032048 [Malus domestica]
MQSFPWAAGSPRKHHCFAAEINSFQTRRGKSEFTSPHFNRFCSRWKWNDKIFHPQNAQPQSLKINQYEDFLHNTARSQSRRRVI